MTTYNTHGRSPHAYRNYPRRQTDIPTRWTYYFRKSTRESEVERSLEYLGVSCFLYGVRTNLNTTSTPTPNANPKPNRIPYPTPYPYPYLSAYASLPNRSDVGHSLLNRTEAAFCSKLLAAIMASKELLSLLTTACCSLLPAHYSLLTAHYSLLTTHYSLFTTR